MTKEAFIKKNFKPDSLTMIGVINGILEEYRRQNFRLSLRQTYYQLVARDFIPNTPRSYKNMGNLVSDARQAGLIDWAMIEDRGRETVTVNHWTTPSEILRACANQYRIDKWLTQPYHVEVMVEKDALSGVLEPTCRQLDVPITANKGYSSSSTMYEIGKRLYAARAMGKKITVIYLGDHDPSGIDMTRDVDERLKMYSRVNSLEVVRVALNYEQVEVLHPPENPAKESDARFAEYAERFGVSSWELDAVEPVQLAQLVRTAVDERRDEPKWAAALKTEQVMRDHLTKLADDYDAEHEDDEPEDEEEPEDDEFLEDDEEDYEDEDDD